MKHGFLSRTFVLPVVNDVVQKQLELIRTAASRQYEALGADFSVVSRKIVDIRSQMEQEVKQLNEVGRADLDDRETKLVTQWKDQLSEILENQTSLLNKHVALAERVERICDSVDTICNVIANLKNQKQNESTAIELIGTVKTELNDAVRQSRSDTATAIKNTRSTVADLDSKLDAFIDTISEKLAQLKRRN
jgi:chromosome segregation ATPase